MLVKDILSVAKGALEEKGIDEADVNARLLMCHLLNLDQTQLFMHWGRELDENQCDIYFELLDRRFERVPLQRIVGHQNFYGEDFNVADEVLIPRPETELLVDKALENLPKTKKATVLDLCTGSGIIGITIAKNMPKVKVFASDISEQAVRLAGENAKKLKVKITVKQGDLFEPFKKGIFNSGFDMIVSNPPYIPSKVIDTLQIEVKNHEPRLALDGGDDGLHFYRKILENAYDYLLKGGQLLMEIGAEQAEAVKEIAAACGKYQDVRIEKDYAGLDRIFYCKRI